RHGRKLRDRLVTPAERTRHRIEALAMATGAGFGAAFVPGVPGGFLAGLFGIEAGQLQAGAETAVAPSMLGVIRKHARVGFGKARAATGAGALDREMTLRGASVRQAAIAAFSQRLCVVRRKVDEHAHAALAVFEGGAYRRAQTR